LNHKINTIKILKFFDFISLFCYLCIEKINLIMTKEERHNLILDTLIKYDHIQVTDLASLLSVSSVTIRKDLTELEKANRLYRSHGKAILINPYINNRSVNEKEKLATVEKHKIGEYAASRIAKDDSIIIGSGSTVTAFARCIRPTHKLTAITSSLQVADILAGCENIDIIQLGGILRHSSRSVVGKSAEQVLAGFSCSQLFLGVDGIDLDFGITTTDLREAELNRAMMRATQKTIVLADSSKFRRRGFSRIGSMEEVDLVITDSNIPDQMARRMEELGIEYVTVDVPQR
jgi:DeoR/GlpR family transcriptional regulator of sugar metabolism